MLKNMFKPIVITRTASAAHELTRNLSAHQSHEIGIDPNTYVQEGIARMKADSCSARC